MKRLFAHSLAILIAVFVSYCATGSASRPNGANLTPLYIPQFAESVTVPCATTEVLARISYWVRPGDNTYVAKFIASGGPGEVQITSDLEQRVWITLPANSPEQEYILELQYPPAKGERGLAKFAVSVVTNSCASKGSAVVVEGLNLFVGP